MTRLLLKDLLVLELVRVVQIKIPAAEFHLEVGVARAGAAEGFP